MELSVIEEGKRVAAERAVLDNIKDGMLLGIGSGTTVIYAVKKIAELELNVRCIPTSTQSRQLIIENGLELANLDETPIDIDIDGADEIDKNLDLIKGGGGYLVQEKIVASNSKKFIVIADFRKKSQYLGEKWKNGVPIEVIPLAYVLLMKKFRELGGKPFLRRSITKKEPFISDNGNFIIDVDFGIIKKPHQLNNCLISNPGVVDTGLFLQMTSIAYIGHKDKSIEILKR